MDKSDASLSGTSSRRRCLIRTLKSAAVFGGLLILFGWFLWRAINPADLNHLVLIRRDSADDTLPLQATLTGDVTWDQAIPFHGGHRTGAGDYALRVADISRAWFDGNLTISDQSGKEIATVEIHPTGRYCGSLVILIDADGNAHAAWNEIPEGDQ